MKTLLGTKYILLIAIAAAATVAVVFSYAQSPTPSGSGKVEITNDRIILHPTVDLSPTDLQKMDDALKNYDQQLYRLDTWDDGKVIKTRGTAKLIAEFTSERATAQSRGARHHSEHFVCPYAAGCPQQLNSREAAQLSATESKLISDLTALLQSYAK